MHSKDRGAAYVLYRRRRVGYRCGRACRRRRTLQKSQWCAYRRHAGQSSIARGARASVPEHASTPPHARLRRRVRHLPHVGGLLAPADRRRRCLPPLPAGGRRLPAIPARRRSSARCCSSSGTGASLPARRRTFACYATRPAAASGGGSMTSCRASRRSRKPPTRSSRSGAGCWLSSRAFCGASRLSRRATR